MEKESIFRFMIVEDNPINITIAELIIKKVVKKPNIRSFTIPEIALKAIEEEYGKEGANMPTILLLDLHMPTMDGFEFLNNFNKFNASIKDQFKIFVLTSTANYKEIEKALDYSCVIDCRSKPLTIEVLKQLIKESGF